ncbi:phage holin family protein [Streptomyces gobiensis]|uniref:phage holin family protein n=1 Tax=Streptomyces gobiensis TaxID=2875706 RepID=UPI001E5572C8|nr:phage holin family protein [Streptomyces gobiensis]UGY94385.1 phage holin family protein [Streptomyces gobiensis]
MTDKRMYPKPGEGPGPVRAEDVSEPVARLIREEIRVATDELRTELREHARRREVRLRSAAAVLGLFAGATLTAALVLLLDLVMVAWVAALVVGLLLAVLAWALRTATRERPRHMDAPGGAQDAVVVPGTPPGGPVPPQPPTAKPPPPEEAERPEEPGQR